MVYIVQIEKIPREETKEFFLFARKLEVGGEEGRWFPLGDIVLREETSLPMAVKYVDPRTLLSQVKCAVEKLAWVDTMKLSYAILLLCRERMDVLVKYSKGSFMPMRMLRKGETIQIGARLQFGKTMDGAKEVRNTMREQLTSWLYELFLCACNPRLSSSMLRSLLS